MTFHSINPTNGEPFATYEEWRPTACSGAVRMNPGIVSTDRHDR